MLKYIFKSKNLRWVLSSLDELQSRNESLFHDQVSKLARRRITTDFVTAGLDRGFNSRQIALYAIHLSSFDCLIYGEGNFVYRGILTRNGNDIKNVHYTSTEMLVASGMFSREVADEINNNLNIEIEGMG